MQIKATEMHRTYPTLLRNTTWGHPCFMEVHSSFTRRVLYRNRFYLPALNWHQENSVSLSTVIANVAIRKVR